MRYKKKWTQLQNCVCTVALKEILKMARHAFSFWGVLEWVHWFWYNFSTYQAKTPGLGLNERYFEIDYERSKWLGFKSMYDQKFANQRSKTTLLLLKSLWKMCQFDRNMMGNSQNLSDTKFLRRYLQLETVSSSMAQFVDKWQKKMCNSLLILWEKQWFFSKIEHFSLFLGRLFFQNPIC